MKIGILCSLKFEEDCGHFGMKFENIKLKLNSRDLKLKNYQQKRSFGTKFL